MDRLQEHIDKQIRFNEGKNLFYETLDESMKFAESTIDLIRNLDNIPRENIEMLIDYTTEKVLQEFCRVNQYLSFKDADKSNLRKIYVQLFEEICRKKTPMDVISRNHYQHLKSWLQKTNSFLQDIYREKDQALEPVVCSEYSADLQKSIFCLDRHVLSAPILDIGCGKECHLVKSLRKEGLETYGIDRFSNELPYIEKTNWLEYDYGNQKWGTIISHLGFSNHFIHHHLRKDGDFIGYAKKYMDILNGLKTGGCFYYAPDLPFIEAYLDPEKFSVTKSSGMSMIKRLK
ncbi:MAG: hypothetical protein LBQ60_14965 [Bacteroidales bacterium]|jgi:2-polyprenyl-3-methyl-5-hydroxy-6-metoxy-1,4-benzoquinol methylase|nr:hypothetical protein [Bacteroidales bacterium]